MQYRNAAILAAVNLCLLVASPSARAGRDVFVDIGDNYSGDGQMWPDFASLPTGLVGSIDFALDFGSGAATNRFFFLDPHGQIQFVTDATASTNTGDVIKPLLNAAQYAPRSNIGWAKGLIDPSLLDATLAPQFGDKSQGLALYRFLWNFVCPTTDPSCSGLQFEATLVHLTDEAFVLQFNYGFNDPITGVTTGFTIGTNSRSFSGPFADTGPDYCFNRGVLSDFTTIKACVGSTSTTVPEPDAMSLLLLGGVGLIAGLKARRRSRKTLLA